ncbi:MAG: TIGR02757 family protein [Saprospiraceae bacterium]|nr:TIGR02757 family protein [Saprospiraceae bacterium]MBP7679454.1 TIGR02757 family protein [Saprospiraceae bacterium]
MPNHLQFFLDDCVKKYNQSAFILYDPVSIPHRFSKLQDIEIIGFWTAMLAWGQRKTIIKSGLQLCTLMDNAPHDFVVHHQPTDLKPFLQFKHRTFQATDVLYFLAFFQAYYRRYQSLELAFTKGLAPNDCDITNALIQFHETFFSLPDAPQRTRKHIASPATKSTCKRLNMFLRWMVRKDASGVDFGLWQCIRPSQLLIPLDVHVERIARQLGLLQRPQRDWKAVQELTTALRQFDADDPVKYDFALFGLGVMPD